jgi:hypothetical protein
LYHSSRQILIGLDDGGRAADERVVLAARSKTLLTPTEMLAVERQQVSVPSSMRFPDVVLPPFGQAAEQGPSSRRRRE